MGWRRSPLLEKVCWHGAAKIPPRDRPRLPEAAGRLVQVYGALGQQDEAAKWRAEWVELLWAVADRLLALPASARITIDVVNVLMIAALLARPLVKLLMRRFDWRWNSTS